MTVLENIHSPHDLRALSPNALRRLGAEIRELLIESVSSTGGHLGPNLGVVELTIALHCEFDSPRDRIVFDTGHQTYVHKILTGRAAGFDRLRRRGGLSGYPAREESPHDLVENSHASTAVSYADGLSKAHLLTGEPDRQAVAVIGDGALTGGMAWEALNSIAAGNRPNVVVVVNDNGRSYAPTVGGLAEHLDALRTAATYDSVLDSGGRALRSIPAIGDLAYRGLHGAKAGLKDFTTPQSLFTGLGLKYLGPVDGHDLAALRRALRNARRYQGPVLVHCVTRKGAGYAPAENDEADRFHGIGVHDPKTGRPLPAPAKVSWTSVFGDELAKAGEEREEIVAITAAMLKPTGLDRFAAAHPDRVFDVGIAEQHAVTSAVGLAMGGLHPVVAVYATFLNRAFDQLLLDAALHGAGITLALDRAGVTGDDGPSHNGVWDLAVLQVVPGLRIAAPRDGATLRAELREALAVSDAPTVVRFPKGAVPADIPAVGRCGGTDILAEPAAPAALGDSTDSADPAALVRDVLLVAVGAMAPLCLAAAELLTEVGLAVTVVDPRWVKPVDNSLLSLAAEHRLVATVEDGSRAGGVGSAVAQALRDADVDVPLRDFGTPARFLNHGTRQEVLEESGLTAEQLAAAVEKACRRLPVDAPHPTERSSHS
ncbi:1-deoxy-D-xylulose-5-phosphate synthase [Streptomyces sp. NPDC087901]|uniref:1-deoxy-D-xylulose-5-phosphate synthase n=1 Tax=Streptomyces sp. NPDC087901 TaxID=3365818 RepID=UPI0037F6AF3F